MEIRIPELALVVMIGTSGSGKSTFARKHFLPTEILSSDACRGLVADDENDQAATRDAFEVLQFIAGKRLAAGRLTVVDATNVQPEARRPLVELARKFHCLPVALVLDMPEGVCHARNRTRPDRDFGDHVIRNQRLQLRRSLGHLQREGFRHVTVIRSVEEAEAATLVREPLWNNKKGESGPFDIIGDVHGCYDEALELLAKLGYELRETADGPSAVHPAGRRAVFVGDLVDRGPKTPAVLKLVMNTVRAGAGYCVAGNHDSKLARKLAGRDVKVSHGLAESLAQLEQEPPEFRRDVAEFLHDLVSHYVFDGGKLVVAHAGLKEEMQGRGSGAVRSFCMYGETTGETDEFGLPVRYNWAADYRGRAMVVYGHTPVPTPDWLNNTICVDTGCVFGGSLTALRYPERELVSVPAQRVYYEPVRPLVHVRTATLTAQQQHDDVLDLQDVAGKRFIDTTLDRRITIREENASAALEVMSRFAINPKWLIYLPPTMSPSETHGKGEWLEYPTEAFDYYRRNGVASVVCEEKHMGSRAVVIVCKDAQIAASRFGVEGAGRGAVYTRTGRSFFSDAQLEAAFLERVAAALQQAGFYDELESGWFALDCELMPWSAKAHDLVRDQYAAVGAAASAALGESVREVQAAAASQPALATLATALAARQGMIERYRAAYRRYCWRTTGLQGLKLAPFHILASEGHVHSDKPHSWHMDALHRLAGADSELLVATPYRTVRHDDEAQVRDATSWWETLTANGGEGIVVKPADFIASNARGLLQPAIKCRGREYLRIIYGPEYDLPQHLERLRQRGLSAKRSLAIREFCLGIEALTRFVNREPLRRVHECVFGVLALESEPVDPRL
jgi:polynucleotide kinase-phosphatase